MSTSHEQSKRASGTAGASARRKHERRKTNREQCTRDAHPHIGGLLLALEDDPTHEQASARGARGEERVATLLARHLDPTAIVLHDRRIPGGRANIDLVISQERLSRAGARCLSRWSVGERSGHAVATGFAP